MWAEVLTWYDAMRKVQPKGNLPLYLSDPRSKETAALMQESRRTETPEELLAAELRQVLDEPASTDLDGAVTRREITCLKEVWIDLLGRDAREIDSQLTTRMLGRAMRMAGWEQSSTMRHPKYGTPKAFRRKT